MRVKQILLATLFIVFPLISFATDYYIVTSDLNVRTGAGTEYSVSYTLQTGDEVEFLSKQGTWYKIKYLGKVGYANSKYLKYSRTLSDTRLQTQQQIVSYILVLAYASLAIVILVILFKRIRGKYLLKGVTETHRGTQSERDLVLKLLKYGIPAQRIFHDLYVEKHKGHFSQIDLVAITEVGIIVFEVKDYSGWLFGNGNQTQWTQVLGYGKHKYGFYNPIMQNNKHISELRKQLFQFYQIPIYSIVVFYGNCELKEIDFIPNGTFIVKAKRVLEVVKTILRDNKPVLYTNQSEIVRVLKEAVINGENTENQIRHSENIKNMLGKRKIFD